ncbi:unnamed protein product [Pleuronectes platessa]|uniref:Uncharacterized protein n=1 Tax=Pleuronectes platessa TaxID=8262 RepID=A0A9N7TU92_PLEPL|nr:unnamed protein product [Pleuronectes platessa]
MVAVTTACRLSCSSLCFNRTLTNLPPPVKHPALTPTTKEVLSGQGRVYRNQQVQTTAYGYEDGRHDGTEVVNGDGGGETSIPVLCVCLSVHGTQGMRREMETEDRGASYLFLHSPFLSPGLNAVATKAALHTTAPVRHPAACQWAGAVQEEKGRPPSRSSVEMGSVSRIKLSSLAASSHLEHSITAVEGTLCKDRPHRPDTSVGALKLK